MSRDELAGRQAQLVAALVAGGPVPGGFDPVRVVATSAALLRKRAGEAGARWPVLRAQFGPQWSEEFASWARRTVPRGAWRDGWDFARHLARQGRLGPAAATELAAVEATHAYDGVRPPRRRRLPAVRRVGHRLIVQIGGRVVVIARR